ncbi:sialidase/neuraminidase family protein [Cyclobacterium plantarum]|uniref:Uncharacterized protein n=1 Tax=Cyclobacterium plantarum TaxID=2716263 RepID=A0ABX0HEX5_9BACT|nr:hypothetical protein [Cyclobacterium plantarum]NHE58894.1 hypothetical protein [Cyclobacterium plantarum]
MFTLRLPATFLIAIIYCSSLSVLAQTGSQHEPVRYIGGNSIDPDRHEGRLRYAIGVESRQTLRVNRSHPELADGHGWTYNHASNLAYWEGKFYQQYLSNPVDEHIAPGQTLMITSEDGRRWSAPKLLFPPYPAPEGTKIPEGYDGYMMHQRMGFYTSKNGKLLTLAFYGHTEDPFEEGGIGRVVREVRKDGSLGPIYFIRYSSHTDWDESNTAFPFYQSSPDSGFIEACEELLANTLITLQWRDEDNGLDGFYNGERKGSAFSFFTRKDGKTVGLWKRSMTALSDEGGENFTTAVKVPTLTMAGGKVWGQQTRDGRFAMVYNPIDIDEYRYPLIVISSDDGIIFDDMVLVQGEVPPRRFYGRWKDFGPCYVRGIVPGNGVPAGEDMWLTYSMNKEDMWVSRVPSPIRHTFHGPVDDDFDQLKEFGAVPDWNIYAPLWAPVNLVNDPVGSGLSLELKDEDPYDYARAIRVFKESKEVNVEWTVMVAPENAGLLEMDVVDQYGNRPIRIKISPENQLTYMAGHIEKNMREIKAGAWQTFRLEIDAQPFGSYNLYRNGQLVAEKIPLTEAVKSVERISFRTGPYRNLPNRKTPNENPVPPLPGADEKEALGLFYIDNVKVSN